MHFMLSFIQIRAAHRMENSDILPCPPRNTDFWIISNSHSSDFLHKTTPCVPLPDSTFFNVFLHSPIFITSLPFLWTFLLNAATVSLLPFVNPYLDPLLSQLCVANTCLSKAVHFQFWPLSKLQFLSPGPQWVLSLKLSFAHPVKCQPFRN